MIDQIRDAWKLFMVDPDPPIRIGYKHK